MVEICGGRGGFAGVGNHDALVVPTAGQSSNPAFGTGIIAAEQSAAEHAKTEVETNILMSRNRSPQSRPNGFASDNKRFEKSRLRSDAGLSDYVPPHLVQVAKSL